MRYPRGQGALFERQDFALGFYADDAGDQLGFGGREAPVLDVSALSIHEAERAGGGMYIEGEVGRGHGGHRWIYEEADRPSIEGVTGDLSPCYPLIAGGQKGLSPTSEDVEAFTP